MKIFEPVGAQSWIGLTYVEENVLAEATLRYLSSVGGFDIADDESVRNSLRVNVGFANSVLETRVTGSVLVADTLVAFLEVLSETSAGLPDIEWNDECEEGSELDEKIAIQRIWIWKDVWEKWTRDNLGEFPGNDVLFEKDLEVYLQRELDRATRYETRFWEAYAKNIIAGVSDDAAFEMTKDQCKRGEDVVAANVLSIWNEVEPTIIESLNL